jgi:CBS domain-containing protein
MVNAQVVVVEPETELSDVVRLFLERKVGALPVVEPGGAVVGIVSYIDVLQALQDGLRIPEEHG